MKPRLVAIEGVLTGTIFELGDQVAGIGRALTNTLSIPDTGISRFHCEIRPEEERYRLTDLQSKHGTQVNSRAVNSQLLAHGDRIALGGSVFLFLNHDEAPPVLESRIELNDDALAAEHTVQLRLEDGIFRHPEKLLDALPSDARLARDMNALLRISVAITTTLGLDALGGRLLELIFEVVPAERGGILLTRSSPEGEIEFDSVLAWAKSETPGRPVTVSRTVAEQALREKTAIWCNDVLENGSWNQVESLAASRIHSLMCVPLMILDRVLGVLYLDTSIEGRAFDEGHVQLVTAIAAMASASLDRARHIGRLEKENRRLKEDARIEHSMVGDSPQIQKIYKQIARLAPIDSTVLILGESGTGKELAARAIHRNSPRADRPFVALNCAVLSEALLESELFGHERGAFTGAIARKTGKLEAADEGTLFLDEVGEMPPSTQVKLLRVLQEREFERVGGMRPIRVDIRIIAATNRDLGGAIQAGAFRKDLYYRLNVVSITLPALRERPEDIPLLAAHFIDMFASKFNRKVQGVSPEALACLMRYEWPGNVRELQNAMERALVMGLSETVLLEDLPEALIECESASGAAVAQYHEAVTEAKRRVVLSALDRTGGTVTEAAKVLGIHANYLHRLINSLKLR